MFRLWFDKGRGAFRAAQHLGLALGLFFVAPAAFAIAGNPGDPLFCQPQEGVAFLITNSGNANPANSTFTVDADCFGNFSSLPADATAVTSQGITIPTTQGGTLTLTGFNATSPQSPNYVYTPPSPGFTGTDTFTYSVATEWNATAGGIGNGTSAGGNNGAPPNNNGRPGVAYTFSTGAGTGITLNVLPGTTTMTVADEQGPTPVPVPTGSITGCQASQGNGGSGPGPGIIAGCVTGVGNLLFGSPLPQPAHGHVVQSGTVAASTLTYTPTPGYSGPDTFTYYVFGTNTDASNALVTTVTMNVTVSVPVPALSPWAMALMMAGLLLLGARMLRGRFV